MNSTAQARPHRQASWVTVTKREIISHLSETAFWVGTLSTIALMILGFVMSAFLAGSSEPRKVAVASEEAQAIVTLAAQSGERIEPLRLAEDQLTQAVVSGEASSALSRQGTEWVLTIKDIRDRPDLDQIVLTYQVNLNSQQLGVDGTQVMAHTQLRTVVTDGSTHGSAIMIASIAFSVVFVLAVFTYGMQIAQSVTTEKESRIVEILAAAIPIRQLLIGKIVGNTVLAVGQVIILVAVALVGFAQTGSSSLIALITPVAGWFVLFFFVGFASLACLWAAAGAMATRIQDLSQTTTPLSMIVMLVYLLSFTATGSLAKALSYVPVASSVLMPGQLLRGEATWVDAVLALLAAIAFMAVSVWFGSGIYRRGLLQTNAVMTFKQALIGR